MSRIGKKPIDLPQNTEVTVSEDSVTIKGPNGTISRDLNPLVSIKVEEGQIITEPKNNSLEAKAMWGTTASHLKNMITGVNENFTKSLIVEGVGYKFEMQGDSIKLNVGFSHPVLIKIPEGIKCEVEKDTIKITGINKETVGQFAAKIRAIKKPEPYKGKGIRYSDEVIRRKEGKKSV